MKLCLFLRKGRVRGHWRQLETGKRVWVKEYFTRRTRKPAEAALPQAPPRPKAKKVVLRTGYLLPPLMPSLPDSIPDEPWSGGGYTLRRLPDDKIELGLPLYSHNDEALIGVLRQMGGKTETERRNWYFPATAFQAVRDFLYERLAAESSYVDVKVGDFAVRVIPERGIQVYCPREFNDKIRRKLKPLGAFWDAEAKAYCCPISAYPAACELVRSLHEKASEADAEAPAEDIAAGEYSVRVVGNIIQARTPYDKNIVAAFKKIDSATWNASERCWQFARRDYEKVRAVVEPYIRAYEERQKAVAGKVLEPIAVGQISVEVSGDKLLLRSPYDAKLVAAVKRVPTARWDAAQKVWTFAAAYYDELRRTLEPFLQAQQRYYEAEQQRAKAAAEKEKEIAARATDVSFGRIEIRVLTTGAQKVVTLRSPYIPELARRLKAINGAVWNSVHKQWNFPIGAYDEVVKIAQKIGEEDAKELGVSPGAKVASFSLGEGYGGREYLPGTIIRNPEGKICVVLKTEKRYYREDGMSFGVGNDSGYIYTVYYREPTDEERRIREEWEARRAEREKAVKRLEEIKNRFRREGEYPQGNYSPRGETVGCGRDGYGGGDWFVFDDDFIWYIRGHSADGDDWSLNNVDGRSMGWRLPRNAETEPLVDEIRKLVRHEVALAWVEGRMITETKLTKEEEAAVEEEFLRLPMSPQYERKVNKALGRRRMLLIFLKRGVKDACY